MGWARFPRVVRFALLSVAFIVAVAASGALALMLENHADAARAATPSGMAAADPGPITPPAKSLTRTPAAAGFADRWKASACEQGTWPHLDSRCLWARGQKHRHARVVSKQRRPQLAVPQQPAGERAAAPSKVTSSAGTSPSKTSPKHMPAGKTEKISQTGKEKRSSPPLRLGSTTGATF